MKPLLLLTALFSVTIGTAQTKNIAGTYNREGFLFENTMIVFRADSTFEYSSTTHPVFFLDRDHFHEKGKWTISGDTIILNPQIAPKPAIEIDLKEEAVAGDTALTLTFNHVKRYFDGSDNPVIFDTVQIDRLDFAFNEWKKKNRIRVSEHGTVRCAFAGYIPKEIITEERTIVVPRPSAELKSIYVGCYEAQQTKELPIRNPRSTRLTYTVYSNYYLNTGTFRQAKMLIKNKNVLYTRQKPNGKFYKDFLGDTEFKVKRVKG